MRTKPLIAAAALFLAGCATTNPGGDRLAQRDPLEGFNRAVWGFNQGVDKVVLRPVTTVYRAIAPKPVRRGITRVFSNLSEPWSFINNMLQGKPGRAVRNLGRFVVNTTVGVAGLGDPASKIGIKPAPEDLGQTFAAWGMNAGPYLVLPVLGPSTLRDGIGTGAAQFADPYRVCLSDCGVLNNTEQLAVTATQVISTRSDLIDSGADAFLKTSVDPYAAARSAYLQRRRAAIANEEDGAAGGKSAEDAALDAALSDIDAADGTTGATPVDGTAAPATPPANPDAAVPPPVSLPDANTVPDADVASDPATPGQ
jgi:phospholipid-binding lipoprotein MlaA